MAVGNSATVARALISLSSTIEKADETVEEYLGSSATPKEKLAFLKGLFGSDYLEALGHFDESDNRVYNSWLTEIIKKNS